MDSECSDSHSHEENSNRDQRGSGVGVADCDPISVFNSLLVNSFPFILFQIFPAAFFLKALTQPI